MERSVSTLNRRMDGSFGGFQGSSVGDLEKISTASFPFHICRSAISMARRGWILGPWRNGCCQRTNFLASTEELRNPIPESFTALLFSAKYTWMSMWTYMYGEEARGSTYCTVYSQSVVDSVPFYPDISLSRAFKKRLLPTLDEKLMSKYTVKNMEQNNSSRSGVSQADVIQSHWVREILIGLDTLYSD